MAKILINGNREVNGKLSISRGLVDGEIAVGAVLTTHRYFEEITEIESERYLLTDVEIIREDFGTNDFDIQYTLSAGDLEVKDGETNLPKDVIEKIEQETYKTEEQELFHKEVYSKWRSETK